MLKSPLLTNTEAADYLKLSPRTLDRWRWAQRGPSFKKLGGAVRYTLTDLEKFADTAGDR
ncbi:helix-turn-helix domain-containing protein [Sphingomonas aerolata]|uniref:helix-turn-helix domain-containing protein n=1 Tax=Sphingomonas aerolata TaxID=185951 RepID=UPI002FE21F7D